MRSPDLDAVRRLIAHMQWADEHIQSALEADATSPAEAIERHAHVLAAELLWIDRIEGTSSGVAVWPECDVAGCRQLLTQSMERYAALGARLQPDELAREVHYANSLGHEFDNTVGEIVRHVAMHGSYHRGQVALLLGQAGRAPKGTDYISFIRGVPAAPRQR